MTRPNAGPGSGLVNVAAQVGGARPVPAGGLPHRYRVRPRQLGGDAVAVQFSPAVLILTDALLARPSPPGPLSDAAYGRPGISEFDVASLTDRDRHRLVGLTDHEHTREHVKNSALRLCASS